MDRFRLRLEQKQSLGLQQRDELLQKEWDSRVQHSLLCVPTQAKEHVTAGEAARENEEFGAFASVYMNKILRKHSSPAIRRARLNLSKVLLAVGYGKGHGYRFIPEACKGGLTPRIVDVSSVSAEWAQRDLDLEYKKMLDRGEDVRYVRPWARRGEIQDVLENPKEILGFDLAQVEAIYLSRIIGFLPISIMETFGQILSEKADPKHQNCIVVIAAFREDNPDYRSTTSKLHRKSALLQKTEKGAGRPVEAFFEEKFTYFDQKYTALTLKAS